MVKAKTPDTEVVFRDLTRANKKLHERCKNPDALRRRFTEFVSLAQKLTAAMYKEYSALTAQKWKASTFPGWTAVTELFKGLRNIDQHELLIRINVIQSQVYYWDKVEIDELGNKEYRKIRMTVESGYNADATLEKELPNQFDIDLLDKQGNPFLRLVPSERYFKFHLEGRTTEIKKLIGDAGSEDIHQLTSQCYKTLSEYYEFYKVQLAANGKT